MSPLYNETCVAELDSEEDTKYSVVRCCNLADYFPNSAFQLYIYDIIADADDDISNLCPPDEQLIGCSVDSSNVKGLWASDLNSDSAADDCIFWSTVSNESLQVQVQCLNDAVSNGYELQCQSVWDELIVARASSVSCPDDHFMTSCSGHAWFYRGEIKSYEINEADHCVAQAFTNTYVNANAIWYAFILDRIQFNLSQFVS